MTFEKTINIATLVTIKFFSNDNLIGFFADTEEPFRTSVRGNITQDGMLRNYQVLDEDETLHNDILIQLYSVVNKQIQETFLHSKVDITNKLHCADVENSRNSLQKAIDNHNSELQRLTKLYNSLT